MHVSSGNGKDHYGHQEYTGTMNGWCKSVDKCSVYSHSVSARKLTLHAIKQGKGSEKLKSAKEMKGVTDVKDLKKNPISDK